MKAAAAFAPRLLSHTLHAHEGHAGADCPECHATYASPREAMRQGIAYLSEDRRQLGLSLPQSLTANITLATLDRYVTRLRLVDGSAERAVLYALIAVGYINQIAGRFAQDYQQERLAATTPLLQARLPSVVLVVIAAVLLGPAAALWVYLADQSPFRRQRLHLHTRGPGGEHHLGSLALAPRQARQDVQRLLGHDDEGLRGEDARIVVDLVEAVIAAHAGPTK